jgi:hypothetical protein
VYGAVIVIVTMQSPVQIDNVVITPWDSTAPPTPVKHATRPKTNFEVREQNKQHVEVDRKNLKTQPDAKNTPRNQTTTTTILANTTDNTTTATTTEQKQNNEEKKKKRVVKKPFVQNIGSAPLSSSVSDIQQQQQHLIHTSIVKLRKREREQLFNSLKQKDMGKFVPQDFPSPRDAHKLVHIGNTMNFTASSNLRSHGPNSPRFYITSHKPRSDEDGLFLKKEGFALKSAKLTIDNKKKYINNNRSSLLTQQLAENEVDKEVENINTNNNNTSTTTNNAENNLLESNKDVKRSETPAEALYDNTADVYKYVVKMNHSGKVENITSSKEEEIKKEVDELKNKAPRKDIIFQLDKQKNRRSSVSNRKADRSPTTTYVPTTSITTNTTTTTKESEIRDVSFRLEEEINRDKKVVEEKNTIKNAKAAVNRSISQWNADDDSARQSPENELELSKLFSKDGDETKMVKLPDIKARKAKAKLESEQENAVNDHLVVLPSATITTDIVDDILKVVNQKNTKIPASKIPKQFHVTDDTPIVTNKEINLDTFYNTETGLWETKIFPSSKPTSRVEVVHLARAFEAMIKAVDSQVYNDEVGRMKSHVELLDLVASEIIRQVSVTCSERGILIQRVLGMMQDMNKAALKWHQDALGNVEQKKGRIREKNNLITDLQEVVNEKDTTIYHQKQKIHHQNNLIRKMEDKVKTTENRMHKLQKDFYSVGYMTDYFGGGSETPISEASFNERASFDPKISSSRIESQASDYYVPVNVNQKKPDDAITDVTNSSYEVQDAEVNTDPIEGISMMPVENDGQVRTPEPPQEQQQEEEEEFLGVAPRDTHSRNSNVSYHHHHHHHSSDSNRPKSIRDEVMSHSSKKVCHVGSQTDKLSRASHATQTDFVSIEVETDDTEDAKLTDDTEDSTFIIGAYEGSGYEVYENGNDLEETISTIHRKSVSPKRKLLRASERSLSPSVNSSNLSSHSVNSSSSSSSRRSVASNDIRSNKRKFISRDFKIKRLAAEEVDALFIDILDAKKSTPRVQSLRWVNRLILDVFAELATSEFLGTINDLKMVRKFVYEFHLVKFGLASIAMNVCNFLTSTIFSNIIFY